jgi:hypothetical protein
MSISPDCFTPSHKEPAQRKPRYHCAMAKELTNLNLGILMVGSLYWDAGACDPICQQPCQKCSRPQWRQKRLSMSDATAVQVPIHYGRRSKTRGNTFSSIVFDRADKLGQALVVPCIKNICSLVDLIEEATAMWTAEQSGDNNAEAISADWGCSALLPHPDLHQHGALFQDLFTGWANRVAQEHDNYAHHPSVDSSGQLLIDWPKDLSGKPLDLDILLATANTPDERVPDEADIAKSFRADDFANTDYFIHNHQNGIVTSSDDSILNEILRLLQ